MQSREDMKELIERFYKTNRSAVSTANNDLVDYIADMLECTPKQAESGQECLTWVIPKSWSVQSGVLKNLDGEVIVDFANNPLHLWSHSCSVNTKISRNDLEQHLVYSKENPSWIPYHYRNQYNMKTDEWGFSLDYNTYKTLNDEYYYVEINSTLDNSIPMKYIDYTIKGASEETILFSAHTCHPAQVTDGLSCVAILIELIKKLKMTNNKYTYRFVLGPEYYAGAAFLESIPQLEADNIKYGVYLDMLGNNEPIGFQTSFQTNTDIDFVAEHILFNKFDDSFKRPYRKLWGNDEMFYNGPGFNIPTIGIGGDKFVRYHYHVDDDTYVNYNQLLSSIDVLLDIINVFEKNSVPKLKYRGPLYLSKYNFYIDPKIDPEGYANLEAIQIYADGNTSLIDICKKTGATFGFVYNFFDTLNKNNLVELDSENVRLV